MPNEKIISMPQITTFLLLFIAGIYLFLNYEAMTAICVIINVFAIIVLCLCMLVFSLGGGETEIKNYSQNER
jgi:NADH:ubiquinone oxidoreductase subunit 6 (subunit J)